MKSSEFDGRLVRYADALKLVHSGKIIGQSLDGNWLLVQSDDPHAPPAKWHFRIARTLINAVLVAE